MALTTLKSRAHLSEVESVLAPESGSANMRALESKIRTFLSENFPLGEDPSELPADASLIESGLIDSTGVLELVDFLEETFGIRVEDDELLPENLDSIASIVRFVEHKQATASAA
jgi:acyl carrier protein